MWGPPSVGAFPGPSTLLGDTISPLPIDHGLPAPQTPDHQSEPVNLDGEPMSVPGVRDGPREGRRAAQRRDGGVVLCQQPAEQRHRLAAEVGDAGREGVWVASPVDVVGRAEVVVHVAWPVLSEPCALGARRPAVVAVVGLVVGLEDGHAGQRHAASCAADSSIRPGEGRHLVGSVE